MKLLVQKTKQFPNKCFDKSGYFQNHSTCIISTGQTPKRSFRVHCVFESRFVWSNALTLGRKNRWKKTKITGWVAKALQIKKQTLVGRKFLSRHRMSSLHTYFRTNQWICFKSRHHLRALTAWKHGNAFSSLCLLHKRPQQRCFWDIMQLCKMPEIEYLKDYKPGVPMTLCWQLWARKRIQRTSYQ